MKTIMTFDTKSSLCQFVACSDTGQPLAVAQCQIMTANGGQWGEIRNLVVFEAYRRQGVATNLLQVMLRTLRDETSGLPRLEKLLASVDFRYTGADRVFEASGFELIESNPQGALYQLSMTGEQHALIPLH